jgi:SAM-dependent methyltransferase
MGTLRDTTGGGGHVTVQSKPEATEVTPSACLLCGAVASRFSVVGEHVFGGRPEQRFYECATCDVAFLYPPLSEEEEQRFYANEFEQFMEQRAGNTGIWTGPEAHIAANAPHVERRLNAMQPLLRPGMRVLEVGCSSGFMLLALRERGMDVVGVEPSGGFTSFLKSKHVPVYSSLDEYVAAGQSPVDLIIHFFVFEHIRRPVEFLRQCRTLLARDGSMFFEVPSRSDPLVTIYDVPAFHRFYWSVAHHWYFNANSLAHALRRVPLHYELVPEQRYDLSNHMWWALAGRPGGTGKFSARLTPDLERAYKESMRRTGHCDTYFVHARSVNAPRD